jgi:hypothetical protein
MLYKYPQRFPYADLVQTTLARKARTEYELLDTGIFEDNRYFDIFVEYARINQTGECVGEYLQSMDTDHSSFPQLWFRNTWSWKTGAPQKRISAGIRNQWTQNTRFGTHSSSKKRTRISLNNKPLCGGSVKAPGYFKDAFHINDWQTEQLITDWHQALHVSRSVPAVMLIYGLPNNIRRIQRIR